MSDEGFTVWFTGLSCSGKSTLAELLREELVGRGLRVEWLDSGTIRKALNRDLGFSREDIEANLKRIAYECKLLNRNGTAVIVSAVSPYRQTRDQIREDIGRFIEVYCRCPLEVLSKRDKNGLFARAQKGEIANVAGINAPYEEPMKPEVLCNTDQELPEKSLQTLVQTLEILGYVRKRETGAYSAEEEALIKDRLKDLGYI